MSDRLRVAIVLGSALCACVRPPAPVARPRNASASVFHDVLVHGTAHVDLHLPPARGDRAPWLVFVHERGWPAPDEKAREGAGLAVALQQRGVGVAVLSFAAGSSREATLREIARTVQELSAQAAGLGLLGKPVIAGDQAEAAVVASLVLDERFGLGPASVRGVIGLNGIYEGIADGPLERAPPVLLLSAHEESPRSAQSSRALARRLERAGANEVHALHVVNRTPATLGNLAGERNDVCDLVTAFVKGERTTGDPEGPSALVNTWGPRSPLSTEPFWADEDLVVRRPMDSRLRARLHDLYGAMRSDLEPWPLATYAAIDLGDYLRAHPELGSGDWLVITNARGERLVVARETIERERPVIVIGIDDERNLFRMFVTYNVYRTYSWKAETERRPLLVRSVGAFLFVPNETKITHRTTALRPVTGADFALTPLSFKIVTTDPLANARRAPAVVNDALTNDRGCLQCHTLRGEGARAHHIRATSGAVAEGFALSLEEYPEGVLRRFLFEQKDVAKSFGVGPLELPARDATLLLSEIRAK